MENYLNYFATLVIGDDMKYGDFVHQAQVRYLYHIMFRLGSKST